MSIVQTLSGARLKSESPFTGRWGRAQRATPPGSPARAFWRCAIGSARRPRRHCWGLAGRAGGDPSHPGMVSWDQGWLGSSPKRRSPQECSPRPSTTKSATPKLARWGHAGYRRLDLSHPARAIAPPVSGTSAAPPAWLRWNFGDNQQEMCGSSFGMSDHCNHVKLGPTFGSIPLR